MFSTHRPWASGYQAFYIAPHQGGVAEGWIGEVAILVDVKPSSQWLHVKLVPQFDQPQVYVRMTYNGQVLPPCAVYAAPCVSGVSLVVERDSSDSDWPQGKLLGTLTFPYCKEDVVLRVEEKNGKLHVNDTMEPPLYAVGGAWLKGLPQQVASFFPQKVHEQIVVRSRVKDATAWGKKMDYMPFEAWVKQGGIRVNHRDQVWASDNVEEIQHPLYRLRLTHYE